MDAAAEHINYFKQRTRVNIWLTHWRRLLRILKMLGLYLDTIIIGHTFCSFLGN